MKLGDMSKFRDFLTKLKKILKSDYPNARVWLQEEATEIVITIHLQKEEK